jgi:hypothetical protein
MKILKLAAWWVLLLFAAFNSVLAMRYLLPHVPYAATIPNLKIHRIALAIHASFAGIALLIGPFQLPGRSRSRWKTWHRRAGWVYAIAVAVGGIAAIPLSLHASFGPIAGSGFFALAIAWLTTTAIAVWMAVQRRFDAHRRWMLRSYALAAAAISLRIMLPLSAILGLPIAPSYRTIAWACWLVNLSIVETYLLFRPNWPAARQLSSASPLSTSVS